MRYKTFSLEEARSLLPKVRQMLTEANEQVESFVDRLEEANLQHLQIESRMSELKTDETASSEHIELRDCRAKFQESIQRLSQIQREYVQCMTMWVDAITEMGIVLRDLQTGLLDFPAQKGDCEYLLCWRLADDDIEYWHLPNDGFRGRRPLAVLDEYF
jgi:hypothetical protein